MNLTPDEIWAEDRLGRRREAENLIAYLESVASISSLREDHAGHVLAVDAGYGEGKTFFLKRLRDELALNHPVAYVDAWSDDLQDEPLVALVATLEEALSEYATKEVQNKLRQFQRSAGKIAKIVATGLTKRGLGLLITQGAVELLEGSLVLDGDSVQADLNKDAIEEFGKDALSSTSKKSDGDAFANKIALFREGQRSIREARQNLAKVVSALEASKVQPPIVIIIDELDRCRPSYAVKLMEEVKHLFGIDGVIFVLGTNNDQLSHSVSGAYGANFDGRSYLNRFIDRTYTLERPRLEDIVTDFIVRMCIPIERLESPNITEPNRMTGQYQPTDVVIRYLEAGKVSARDVIKFLDSLRLCLLLTPDKKLFAPYLIPLIISRIRNGRELAESDFRWNFWVPRGAPYGFSHDKEYIALNPVELFKQTHAAASLSVRDLQSLDHDRMTFADAIVCFGDNWGEPAQLHTARGYEQLVRTVARFSISRS